MKLCWVHQTQGTATFTILLVVLGVLVKEGLGGGDSGDTSCVNQVSSCFEYLNNGAEEVPDTCCDPLKSVIQNDKTCFCNLLSKKETDKAQQAGINITAAQQLPARCGLRVNPISCLTSPDSPSPKSSNQDSAAALLLPSPSLIVVMALCMILQIFVVLD